MPKEWILNQAMNRWGLNKKRSVGPVSELIRKCHPKRLDDWRDFYYRNAYPESHLEELGRKLYVKITEVVQYEVAEVTEQHCIDYMKEVVIERTFAGYQTEIQTIYGQLQNQLGVPIKPAPDEWDRLYNVDFFVEVSKNKFLGIQIKPVSFEHTFEDHKWKEMQERSHRKFQDKFTGEVFTVFSARRAGKKEIQNPEVVEEIKRELQRLS
ncbi:MAG: MjaI family restriction endonuclease [candidate division Zixibacteria bacterium]|nr:MjaI family restriction endonuclease [candidate division Zixibacteria bacterium]